MSLIPQYLYRGDADPQNKRKLKDTANGGVLLTNLCSGGRGRDIFSNSLGQLIKKHIVVGWDKTHFLSFSTNEQTAFLYGCNNKRSNEIYYDFKSWDFIVMAFDTTLLIPESLIQISRGVYKAEFYPTCKEFLPTFKVLMIDTISHLRAMTEVSNSNFSGAIKKAEIDNEWLILPIQPLKTEGEFTGLLDTACISEKRFYNFL